MKNIKIVVIFLVIFFGNQDSSAQTVNYKTLVNDPFDIAKLTIYLDPFYADTWGTNVSLGYNVKASYEFKKKAALILDFRNAYFDQYGKQFVNTLEGLQQLKKFQYLELGGEYYFIDKEKSSSLKIVLSSSSSGNYTYSKYIMVPGKYRKIRAVRFGLQNIKTPFKIQDSKITAPSWNAYLPGYDFKGYNGNEVLEFEQYNSQYSTMNILMMNVGISAKWITNLIVETNYGGNSRKKKRANANINDIYADLLYAPIISFDDIVTADKKVWELKSSSIKNWGWRIGWTNKSSSRSAVSINTEFGSRPGFYGHETGILGTNLYFVFGFGWTIPIKWKG